MPLELELCSVDDEADSVAVSIIVSSASLHVADSPDVSSRECNISKAMVLRYTCSSSSISPSEDKDSLCFYRRLLFLETVLCRSFASLRSYLFLRDPLGRFVAFLREHFSKSALHGA